jgi:hypothetical protein
VNRVARKRVDVVVTRRLKCSATERMLALQNLIDGSLVALFAMHLPNPRIDAEL